MVPCPENFDLVVVDSLYHTIPMIWVRWDCATESKKEEKEKWAWPLCRGRVPGVCLIFWLFFSPQKPHRQSYQGQCACNCVTTYELLRTLRGLRSARTHTHTHTYYEGLVIAAHHRQSCLPKDAPAPHLARQLNTLPSSSLGSRFLQLMCRLCRHLFDSSIHPSIHPGLHPHDGAAPLTDQVLQLCAPYKCNKKYPVLNISSLRLRTALRLACAVKSL